MFFIQHRASCGELLGKGTHPAHLVFFDRSRKHGQTGLEMLEDWVCNCNQEGVRGRVMIQQLSGQSLRAAGPGVKYG